MDNGRRVPLAERAVLWEPMRSNITRLADALDKPVSNASLALFRMAFGTLLAAELTLLLVTGATAAMFQYPAINFTYLGFGWVQPLPGWGLQAHFAVTALAAAGIALGFLYRTSCLTLGIGWTWFWLMDKSYYQNHTYLVSLVAFWMVFMPANGRWALDAMIRPHLRTAFTPCWTIWFLRAMMGIVYFYAGLAKLYPDWLQGEPMRGHLRQWAESGGIGGLLATEFVAMVLASWGGLLFDLLIVPALLWRRTRHAAVACAVVFHLTNSVLFRIDIFPFLAIAATLMFYPPAWPDHVLARLRGGTPKPHPVPSATALRGRTTPLLRWALGLFFLVQLLLPFHHVLYPGDHNWTEEGHRFSWFLMQRAKQGKAMFLVHVPETGARFQVDPADYLNPRQTTALAIEPDLLVQFAHFLERELAATHPGDLEIRAYVQVRLNGREPAVFVDHTVDLTREHRGWGSYAWVAPHPGPLSDARKTADAAP